MDHNRWFVSKTRSLYIETPIVQDYINVSNTQLDFFASPHRWLEHNLSRRSPNFLAYFKGGTFFVDARERLLTAEANVNKMATNCMPTIQANTEQTNVKLDKMTDILENINTGIAILVDRRR